MVGFYGWFECKKCGEVGYRHNSELCQCPKKPSQRVPVTNRTYSKRLIEILDSHRKRRERKNG